MKKFKIYIILSIFIVSILLHCNIYAFDETSVYVWSNNSSEVTTSITPNKEDSAEVNQTTNENQTR